MNLYWTMKNRAKEKEIWVGGQLTWSGKGVELA